MNVYRIVTKAIIGLDITAATEAEAIVAANKWAEEMAVIHQAEGLVIDDHEVVGAETVAQNVAVYVDQLISADDIEDWWCVK